MNVLRHGLGAVRVFEVVTSRSENAPGTRQGTSARGPRKAGMWIVSPALHPGDEVRQRRATVRHALRILLRIERGIERSVGVKVPHRPVEQIVYQRIQPGRRDLRITSQVPASIEERVRFPALCARPIAGSESAGRSRQPSRRGMHVDTNRRRTGDVDCAPPASRIRIVLQGVEAAGGDIRILRHVPVGVEDRVRFPALEPAPKQKMEERRASSPTDFRVCGQIVLGIE